MAVCRLDREREGAVGSGCPGNNSRGRERQPGRQAATGLREGIRATAAARGQGLAVRMPLLPMRKRGWIHGDEWATTLTAKEELVDLEPVVQRGVTRAGRNDNHVARPVSAIEGRQP